VNEQIAASAGYLAFAAWVVVRQEDHLLDYGPEEQAITASKQLERFAAHTPLTPVTGQVIDLAGFGEAPVHYRSAKNGYVLLSEVAEALGWPLHKAHAWAERDHGWALRDQREEDENRGDGRLGFELMTHLVDLRLSLTMDDPEAKPDAGGRRWSDAGDWLVSHDRLPALMTSSPWAREFMDNTMDAFGHAMRKIHGDKLKGIPLYRLDGEPTGGNAFDDMFSSDLTEDEALRKARRGPTLDGIEDGD